MFSKAYNYLMDLGIKVMTQPVSVVRCQVPVSHHLHSLHFDASCMKTEERCQFSYLIRKGLFKVSKSEIIKIV